MQADSGIVTDSSPASEQHGCINTSRALFRAAEEARRFASAGSNPQTSPDVRQRISPRLRAACQ